MKFRMGHVGRGQSMQESASKSEYHAPSDDFERLHICPMHPEVRQQEPGPCPKCGMALEPGSVPGEGGIRLPHAPGDREGSAWLMPHLRNGAGASEGSLEETEANPELADMTRRFWLSAVLAVPVLFLAMSDMIPGQPMQFVWGTV